MNKFYPFLTIRLQNEILEAVEQKYGGLKSLKVKIIVRPHAVAVWYYQAGFYVDKQRQSLDECGSIEDIINTLPEKIQQYISQK